MNSEIFAHCLGCQKPIAPAGELIFIPDRSGCYLGLRSCDSSTKNVFFEPNPKKKSLKICPHILKHICGAKIGNEVRLSGASAIYSLSRDECYLTGEMPSSRNSNWIQIQGRYPQIQLQGAKVHEPKISTKPPPEATVSPSDLSTPTLKRSKPRPFQTELYGFGIQSNSMLCVPTGCGKTLTSIMFITKMLRSNPKKNAVFVVHRIPLSCQQAAYIRAETDYEVIEVNSDKHLPKTLDKQCVLSITADCFLNHLQRGDVRMEDFCALVFDECHNGVGNHSYTKVMDYYNQIKTQNTKPRIMCLTASPAEGKKGVLETKAMIRSLCSTFDVNPIYPRQTRIEFESSIATSTKPQIYLIESNMHQALLNGIICTAIMQIIPECMKHHIMFADYQNVSILRSVQESYGLTPQEKENVDLTVRLYKITEIVDMFGTRRGKEELLKELGKIKNQQLKEDLQSEVNSIPSSSSQRIDFVLQKLRGFKEDKAMIFVRTKAAGKELYEVLRREVSYLEPEIIFGHSGEDGMRQGRQKSVLERFRLGKSKVLIATSVVEEGLDVPDCNLVIAFDGLASSKSMMQIRGRARRENSNFIMICKSEEQGKLFIEFLRREKYMKEALKQLAN
eukprot:TRINITY_DN7738_c0_g1_i1.p1 TRINITY_DN7738_c0_g1~~TRINITY_DN7738_c0_g1_i1.p1  ORF type:complete len:619 (-),score=34.77 TRINITY_DN7738_c0_g1_i1:11-1867(-)